MLGSVQLSSQTCSDHIPAHKYMAYRVAKLPVQLLPDIVYIICIYIYAYNTEMEPNAIIAVLSKVLSRNNGVFLSGTQIPVSLRCLKN